MSSNSDDIHAAGSDTRPPMLDRTDYESWSQRTRLYCRGKENGIYILQSIDHGPFELGTTRDTIGTTPEGGVLLRTERPRTYDDLNENEKKRFDADVRATNIVLQGLPKDIYKLINHNIEAKAIWDNVKMLLARSELTKKDRESQLYDEFERFKMLPGENINEYYVRFHKLINDMRNIRMTMPNIQLNSKFVNNMSLEWDRFVTSVKLNKGLKETNHEQLYAYLKQHEKHAAQDRLIIEKITPTTNDPLAFVLNVQPYAQLSHVQSHQHPSSSTPIQSPHAPSLQYSQFPEPSHIDSRYSQTDELIDTLTKQVAFLAQSFRVTLPQTNNQLRTSSNTRNQATVQDGRVVVQNVQGRQNQNQRNFARGAGAAGNGGALNRPKRPQNSDFFKDKMLLMQAQENSDVLDEEELLFLADVDDEPTAQSIFIANLSSTGPANHQAGPSNASILSEVHDLENTIDHCDIDQDKHEIHNEVQQKNVIDSNVATLGNSNVIPYEQYLSVNEVSVEPSCASSVLIDAFVLYDNNVYIPHDPLVTELSIYKQQVAMYEQRAKFDLTLREQKMDEQMRILIQDHNQKEENLKNEIHSVKLQLNSTIKSNNKIEETVIALTNEFKQKEIKFLTDFSNLKTLNNKLKNKLYAQDQSIQTVHMMLKPKRLHDQDDVTAIGHFDEVQRSLVKEVRAMKAVFENMEAGVDQNAINKKCGEIERKNILITNENLIANCIAQDVFYTVTDSTLSASRFHDLSTAYNVAMNHVVELEYENSKLLYKIQHDNHDAMELLANVCASCPKESNKQDNGIATTPVTKKKHVTFADPLETSGTNTTKHVKQPTVQTTNVPIMHSTRVRKATKARRSKSKNNTLKDKTLPAKSVPEKTVEDHHRKNKSKLSKKNRVDSSTSVRRTVFNTNSNSLCKTCKQCPLTRNTKPKALPVKQWKPTGRLIPLGRQCPLVRPTALNNPTMPANPQTNNLPVVQIVLWYLDSGCSKHMTGDRSRLRNFVKKFIGTVRFINDHFGVIMGYGDYVIGDSVISSVYYVEGLGHNLFSVG
ncbi:hypothetical protein Tco_0185844 [Tanacetum coccineum]